MNLAPTSKETKESLFFSVDQSKDATYRAYVDAAIKLNIQRQMTQETAQRAITELRDDRNKNQQAIDALTHTSLPKKSQIIEDARVRNSEIDSLILGFQKYVSMNGMEIVESSVLSNMHPRDLKKERCNKLNDLIENLPINSEFDTQDIWPRLRQGWPRLFVNKNQTGFYQPYSTVTKALQKTGIIAKIREKTGQTPMLFKKLQAPAA